MTRIATVLVLVVLLQSIPGSTFAQSRDPIDSVTNAKIKEIHRFQANMAGANKRVLRDSTESYVYEKKTGTLVIIVVIRNVNGRYEQVRFWYMNNKLALAIALSLKRGWLGIWKTTKSNRYYFSNDTLFYKRGAEPFDDVENLLQLSATYFQRGTDILSNKEL